MRTAGCGQCSNLCVSEVNTLGSAAGESNGGQESLRRALKSDDVPTLRYLDMLLPCRQDSHDLID
jgi:hypothetical protein